MTAITGRIVQGQERIGERSSLIGWLALGVVHCHVCPHASTLDRKLLRLLLQLHTQVTICLCQRLEAAWACIAWSLHMLFCSFEASHFLTSCISTAQC